MTRYLSLAQYLMLAELVTGEAAESIAATARIELADSALHAPQAEFDGVEFYPDIIDKGAVLLYRLARNHPLNDGNKRAAWMSLLMFFELNDETFSFDASHTDAAQAMVEGVAAGERTEAELAAWLRKFVDD